MGHPLCEFCRTPFYGDNELYSHMSTEHYTCHMCQRYGFMCTVTCYQLVIIDQLELTAVLSIEFMQAAPWAIRILQEL